ncbi:MAG: type II toxin-antitoxin system RelE/ParE family toxin [Treponema sp.]|nr:type II toxin-antitoxin system RelE/ParE family toxin [Treponema sp.]MCL2252596.1 type II toxin-antitoxin system RelE/ParE family toxin [Treponema sp.]
MTVLLRPVAAKYFERLSATDKERFRNAFNDLAKEPPEGDIKTLKGWNGYFRLRIGGYRVLFRIEDDIIIITNIDSRGQVYKKKNKRKK